MRTDAERSAVVAVAKKLDEVLARLGEEAAWPVLEGVLEEVEARIAALRDPAYREQAERLGAA